MRSSHGSPPRSRMLARLALSLLNALPMGAVVIQGGATPSEAARLEAEAHAAGLKHTFVLGIVAVRPAGAGSDRILATGVYFGPSADRRKGFVLTSAHPFAPLPRSTTLAFGASIGALTLPVTRIVVHPHASPEPWVLDPDLAILEFDFGPAQARLTEAGITPAALYDAEAFEPPAAAPFLEAEVAGFGRFGTHGEPALTLGGAVHGGKVRVIHERRRGRTKYWHGSLVPPPSADGPAHFIPVGQPLRLTLEGPETAWLHSHPQEALPVPGDSGGPLIFQTADGPRVAGICSGSTLRPLASGPVQGARTARLSFWEPIAAELDWIRGVTGSASGAGPLSVNAREAPPDPPEAPSLEEGWVWADPQPVESCLPPEWIRWDRM